MHFYFTIFLRIYREQLHHYTTFWGRELEFRQKRCSLTISELQFITILHDICHFYKEIIVEKVKFITNYLFLSGKSINFALANLKRAPALWADTHYFFAKAQQATQVSSCEVLCTLQRFSKK